MKRFLLSAILGLVASPSFATVDGHTRVYLVVEDINSGDFFVESAPMIGCYGTAQGPQLAQFTAEYKVPSNIGCGGQAMSDNINYLTCAKVESSKENDDYTGFSEITLNIAGCKAKDNAKFIAAVKKAAKLNFPLKRGTLKFNLVK